MQSDTNLILLHGIINDMKSIVRETPKGKKKGLPPPPIKNDLQKHLWTEGWKDVFIPKKLRGKIKIIFDKNTGQPVIKLV